MKKTITVLGASGKIGSKISAILLKEGHHVKLVARNAEDLKKFSDMGDTTIAAIQRSGIKYIVSLSSYADPFHKIPMVATRDVASVATKYLANQDFSGKVVLPKKKAL